MCVVEDQLIAHCCCFVRIIFHISLFCSNLLCLNSFFLLSLWCSVFIAVCLCARLRWMTFYHMEEEAGRCLFKYLRKQGGRGALRKLCQMTNTRSEEKKQRSWRVFQKTSRVEGEQCREDSNGDTHRVCVAALLPLACCCSSHMQRLLQAALLSFYIEFSFVIPLDMKVFDVIIYDAFNSYLV